MRSWRMAEAFMEYFVQPVRWSGQTLYLIYYSNDQDGVLTQDDRTILHWDDSEQARLLCKKRKLKLQPDLPLLDLESIQVWSQSRIRSLPEAAVLYRCWNFLGDIATSRQCSQSYLGYDSDFSPIHEELFWGSNLPGFSQSQEVYQIDLSQTEIKALRKIMRSGLEIFQQGLET